MEIKTGSTDYEKLVESTQECVVENKTVGSLNMVNHDVGSDDLCNTVDTCDIVLHMKPEILSLLRAVADISD